MKKVTELDLAFKNQDYAVIPAEDIISIKLGNLKSAYQAKRDSSLGLQKFLVADTADFLLNLDFLQNAKTRNQNLKFKKQKPAKKSWKKKKKPEITTSGINENIYTKITNEMNITSIRLVCNDQSNELIYVHWADLQKDFNDCISIRVIDKDTTNLHYNQLEVKIA